MITECVYFLAWYTLDKLVKYEFEAEVILEANKVDFSQAAAVKEL